MPPQMQSQMPSQSRGAPEPSAGYPPGRGSPRRPPAVPQRAPSAGYPPAPHPTHQPPPPPLQRGGITSGGMPHHGASGGGASGGGAYGGGPGHLLPQSQWDAEYAELCREVAMLEASLDNLRRVQTERKWHDACWLDSMLRMVQSRLQASIDAKNDAAPDPEGALPPEEAMQGMQPAEGAQPPAATRGDTQLAAMRGDTQLPEGVPASDASDAGFPPSAAPSAAPSAGYPRSAAPGLADSAPGAAEGAAPRAIPGAEGIPSAQGTSRVEGSPTAALREESAGYPPKPPRDEDSPPTAVDPYPTETDASFEL